MDTDRSSSPADRDAALRRLRTMTVATTLAGAAAVVTFGAVAAISNPGHQAATVAGDAAGTGSTPTATPAPATDTTIQAPAQVPLGVLGGGQTTTGGS